MRRVQCAEREALTGPRNSFIQSDPWWALAMAINVLLIFFTNTNPHTIKKWGWLYCLICYGGPFIISLICLKLRSPDKTLVYGNASVSFSSRAVSGASAAQHSPHPRPSLFPSRLDLHVGTTLAPLTQILARTALVLDLDGLE